LTDVGVSTYVDNVKGTTKLANAAGSRDPAVGLRAVASLRQLVEELQELQVTNARDRGWSWQEIADALGVSRQAVHKKYAGRRILRREK
jgi:DNA-directed RNA polymerase specialized sigma24 family protein